MNDKVGYCSAFISLYRSRRTLLMRLKISAHSGTKVLPSVSSHHISASEGRVASYCSVDVPYLASGRSYHVSIWPKNNVWLQKDVSFFMLCYGVSVPKMFRCNKRGRLCLLVFPILHFVYTASFTFQLESDCETTGG